MDISDSGFGESFHGLIKILLKNNCEPAFNTIRMLYISEKELPSLVEHHLWNLQKGFFSCSFQIGKWTAVDLPVVCYLWKDVEEADTARLS